MGQNFVEIALTSTISEIDVILCLTQKLKRATKNSGKIFFEKTLWVKNSVEIALSRSISDFF